MFSVKTEPKMKLLFKVVKQLCRQKKLNMWKSSLLDQMANRTKSNYALY